MVYLLAHAHPMAAGNGLIEYNLMMSKKNAVHISAVKSASLPRLKVSMECFSRGCTFSSIFYAGHGCSEHKWSRVAP